MTQTSPSVNTVAPLANVGICVAAIDRALSRSEHLPGMITFYGPSGYGKSTAAAYAANKLRAYYVQCLSAWTKKSFLIHVLKEMGVRAAPTIADMTLQVAEELALSGRPLIIDEMDHLAEKKAVEIVRDIYEASGGAAILLIGEEGLPGKLRRWERFHGRMLDWIPAQPADIDDARHLRELYCRHVKIADDLLNRVTDIARGSVRRICVNLDRIEYTARNEGLTEIDLATWGDRDLFTGEAPRRRV